MVAKMHNVMLLMMIGDDCVYEVTRMTRGVLMGPLTRFGVYLRITYMFMECVSVITHTTRGVPKGYSHDLRVFLRFHSLRCALVDT